MFARHLRRLFAPHRCAMRGTCGAPWGHILDYILVLAGLLGLILGGEALVRGSVGLATRLAMPPFLIGLTIVGFGTSMPEMLVSVDAALRGVPDVAIGNVVGSNIANILLIVGLTALVWPISVQGSSVRRDCLVMLAASVLILAIFAQGSISGLSGGLLVLALLGYLGWSALSGAAEPDANETHIHMAPLIAILWIALALVALIFGARFLIDGAVSIAREFGVSEAFIGLTIIAVGTSLPELATSLIAALRRQSAIAIGNVIGSNIFNVLGILGVTALITPVPVAPRFVSFDGPIMIGVTLVLVALLVLRSGVGRLGGAVLLGAYVTYLWAAQG